MEAVVVEHGWHAALLTEHSCTWQTDLSSLPITKIKEAAASDESDLRTTQQLVRARWSAAQLLRSSDVSFIFPFVFMQQPPRRCRAAIVWVPLLRRSETRWQTECQTALNSTTQSALNETRLLWKWRFAHAWICNNSVNEALLSIQGRFVAAHCYCSAETNTLWIHHDSCYSSLIEKQKTKSSKWRK